jgi:glycosyltransferase involved in cell wall biosynthesis
VRVVFFVQGERVPAARARGFAIARALEGEGWSCSVRVPRPSVYGDTRLPWPLDRPRPLYAPFAALSRLGQLRDLRDDDVVVFQRPMVELPTTLLERLAGRRRRTVFDFDDAIFERRGVRGKFERLVGLADRVVAGSRYLAAAARAPGKTTVIPTAVDTDRFAAQPPRAGRGAGVVVGWTGLASNYRQLASAAPAIARALQRTGARFLAISDEPPPAELAPLGAEFVRWRPESEVRDLARVDVGVMPLPDSPFERGKCAYKLIQYMALARPGVASPVGANCEVVTDGVDGFLPADAAAWEESLVRLVMDPELREEVGRRARARVEGAYSLRAVLPLYTRMLTDLDAARRDQ